ncbi:MAG: asparaginase [Methylococcaceae bacterium]|nr:asparaginase [Methylococcaceae bacterium]
MKKILVVFTGGTIGSSVCEHTINPAAENQFRLLALYRQRFARATQIDFVPIAPVELLSENLTPEVWGQIINAIDAVDRQDLAGIIVTHGTDTLAFSACALSYYFAQLNMPLVLVSSDYPLTDARANGLDNFNAAVVFIAERAESGVFVAYQNQGQATYIHLGLRLASCLQLSSDFMSVQAKAYLQFADEQFTVLNALPPHATKAQQPWQLKAQFSKRVLLIKPYPGLNYARFNLQEVEAVLHDCYHSGTACVSDTWGEQYSLLSFMQRCKNQGITVYLAPAVSSPDSYSSTKAFTALGAEILWDISLEAAYVKLLLAYGNFEDTDLRRTFMQQNIANEILEFDYS